MVAIVELHADALALARRYSLASTYDAHFLAVALRENCEFWTADRRLFNAVKSHISLVRYVDRQGAAQ